MAKKKTVKAAVTHLVRIDREVETALRRSKKPGESWNDAARRVLRLGKAKQK